MRIGVLVPSLSESAPLPPASLPFGRAAMKLAGEGIEVVFGDRAERGQLVGTRAIGDRWSPIRRWPVAAAFDRYPARSRPASHRALLRGLGAIPVAHPPTLAALCSDKLATQRVLTRGAIPMPEVETDPRRFAAALAAWGTAFLKPRYGAFGRGVCLVRPGEPVPAESEGAVPGMPEPTFLQRHVRAPPGFAGISARVLVQRLPDGTWRTDPVVARWSRTDPVVNAARGSSVDLLASLVGAEITAEVAALAVRCLALLAEEPDGDLLVEGGVDVAIDRDHRPWVLEVNGTPRGRLEVLRSQSPAAFHAAHVESCARPLRTLAARFGSLGESHGSRGRMLQDEFPHRR